MASSSPPSIDYEYQGSFHYITAACFSSIAFNLMVFPVDYVWCLRFPAFAALPQHIRRHDANLLMRAMVGPVIGSVVVYITVMTLADIEFWFKQRAFITYVAVIFLMLDIFDLTQKRRFEWHPYVHHIVQTGYTLYLFEWGDAYGRAFPNLGLVLFSLLHKPMLGLFPLRRMSKKDGTMVRKFAKFAFADVVLAIIIGLGVMLALTIKHRNYLPLSAMIVQPIFFLFFNSIDLPFYTFIYKIAYGEMGSEKKVVEVEKDIEAGELPVEANATSAPIDRRASLQRSKVHNNMSMSQRLSISSRLVSNRRNTILGMPFFDDENEDTEDEDTEFENKGNEDACNLRGQGE